MVREEVENRLNELSLEFLIKCMEVADKSYESITVIFGFRQPILSKTIDYRPFWLKTKFGKSSNKREVFGINSGFPLPSM